MFDVEMNLDVDDVVQMSSVDGIDVLNELDCDYDDDDENEDVEQVELAAMTPMQLDITNDIHVVRTNTFSNIDKNKFTYRHLQRRQPAQLFVVLLQLELV
jgi:hypothetical protein